MRLIGAVVTTLLALGAGAPIAAAQGIAPPGVSALDQYVESVPTAAGNQVLSDRARSSRPSTGVLARRVGSRMRALGADGARAAALARESAPPTPLASTVSGNRSRGASPGKASQRASRDRGTTSQHSRSQGSKWRAWSRQAAGTDTRRAPGVAALAAATGSGGGMGLLLPLILVASAVAAAFSAVRRRAPA